MANPTPFSALDGFMNKQVIACVRAKVVKVDNIARGTSQYGDWAMQFASIRDTAGTAYNLTITDPTYFLSQAAVGKVFTAESTPQSKGGPAGVCMSIRDNKGQEQRSIKIDNRAKIVWDGGEAPYMEDSSAPSNQNAMQGGGISAQSGPVFDQSPVRERVHAYLEILKEVSAQYKHLLSEAPEGSIPKLTPSDIKDIATHVSMTYRGDLGSYAKPIFKKPEPQKPQRQEEDHYDNSGGDLTEDDIPFDSAWRKLGSSVF